MATHPSPGCTPPALSLTKVMVTGVEHRVQGVRDVLLNAKCLCHVRRQVEEVLAQDHGDALPWGAAGAGGQQGSDLPLGPEVGCPRIHGGQASQRQPLGQPRACQHPRFPICCVWGSLSLCSALPGLRPPGKRPPRRGSRCSAHCGARCPRPRAGPELRAPGSRSGGRPVSSGLGTPRPWGGEPALPVCPLRGGAQESEPRPQPPALSPDHICPVPVLRPACWGPRPLTKLGPPGSCPPPAPDPSIPYSGSRFPGPARRLRR